MTLPCPRRAEAPYQVTSPESDHWLPDHTCSYCGSLEPAEFLRRAEAGEKLSPTDKNYKIYLSGAPYKFYFQHLNKEQCEKFVELYNAKKLVMDGGFYVRPFFVRPAPAGA